jgi:molybdopterin-guanine dinucleotide biosynthesis protein A
MVIEQGVKAQSTAKENVLGLVLAGGQSSRMGRDKAQLCLGEHSLLDVIKRTLHQSGIEQVMISSNHVTGALSDKIVGCGPLSALHSIVNESISSQFSGVLLVPVDMPLLLSAHLTQLHQYGLSHHRVCYYAASHLPVYIPFSTTLKDLINQQMVAQHYALKNLLSKMEVSTLELDKCTNQASELSPFYNVNTPEQWQQLAQWHGKQKNQRKPKCPQ